jgi:hypothetical protein
MSKSKSSLKASVVVVLDIETRPRAIGFRFLLVASAEILTLKGMFFPKMPSRRWRTSQELSKLE